MKNLNGMTASVYQKLVDAGYDTLEKLAAADAEELAKLKGVTIMRATSLIVAANERLSPPIEPAAGDADVPRSVRVERIYQANRRG